MNKKSESSIGPSPSVLMDPQERKKYRGEKGPPGPTGPPGPPGKSNQESTRKIRFVTENCSLSVDDYRVVIFSEKSVCVTLPKLNLSIPPSASSSVSTFFSTTGNVLTVNNKETVESICIELKDFPPPHLSKDMKPRHIVEAAQGDYIDFSDSISLSFNQRGIIRLSSFGNTWITF